MGDHSGGESSPDSDIESTGLHNNRKNGSSCSQSVIREQDRLLPIANVGRIMKQTLPANAKISKEAKEIMQECVSEFISFVTGEASDKCHKEKRKTINGDDILWAMTTLGFEVYAEPLKIYLDKYREVEGEKLSMSKQLQADQPLPEQLQPYNPAHNRPLLMTYKMPLPMPTPTHGKPPAFSSTDPAATGHGRRPF